MIFGISSFNEIEKYYEKFKFDYLYVQKGGEKDLWVSNKIKTIIHSMYPQKLSEVHGYNYSFISEWLSVKFSNKKVGFVPYIVETYKTEKDLKKILHINKNSIVLGCHGGESSFDLKFAKDCILKLVKNRKILSFYF